MTAVGCAHKGCEQSAIARVCTADASDGRPVYVILRPACPNDRRGYPACLHHAHHALDVLLMAARESTPSVCKSREWGLCNGIGCPICSPEEADR